MARSARQRTPCWPTSMPAWLNRKTRRKSANWKVDRKQLSKYADFPLDKYIRQVLLMLEQ